MDVAVLPRTIGVEGEFGTTAGMTEVDTTDAALIPSALMAEIRKV